jgi:hypothetical protein
VADLRQRFTEIDQRARDGADVAADLSAASDKFGATRSFLALLRQSAQFETFEGDARPDRIEEIRRALSATVVDSAAMAPLLEKFADDIRNTPPLAHTVEEAKALAKAWRERYDRLPSITLEGADALLAAINALDAHRKTKPPAAETAVERREKLEALCHKLEEAADKVAESCRLWLEKRAEQSRQKAKAEAKVKALRKPATAKSFDAVLEAVADVEHLSGEEAAGPDLTGMTPLPKGLPSVPAVIETGLPLPANMSLSALQSFRFWTQLLTNAVALGFIGLAGVWALWLNNPTWGGMVDMLTAIFTGAATRLVAGEARPPTPPSLPGQP